jgi:hypothetical protein
MKKGYDVFFERPGEISRRVCQVCCTECLVERNRVGPTSWSAAIGKFEILHDYFYCPHLPKDWHKQALALVEAIDKTPSKRVTALMRLDLIDLLSEHGCTPEIPDV